MMKTSCATSVVLLICALVFTARGQQANQPSPAIEPPQPYSVLKRGLDANNYLTPLVELEAREAVYLASDAMRESYLEMMTLLRSYTGDMRAAYAYEDKLLTLFEPRNRTRERNAKNLSAHEIDNLRPSDAIDAIGTAAQRHQVVMINEEHRTPVHRALTLRLLPVLYARGFRYFAAETVSEEDTELNRRGYPVQKTGFYTADPVYADVIRTALRLGYKVVPYEHIPKGCQPEPDNPESCNDERERGQAQNLYDRILKNDPEAKIFVHVGRAHNARVRTGEQFAFMGWYFRDITKITPFVIDQVRMSERHSPADEHPVYRYATKKYAFAEPTVFRSADGTMWSDNKDIADVRIFQPRAVYERGRPTWLRLGGLRRMQEIELKRLKLPAGREHFGGREPVLVQAFVAGEKVDAVPVDQVVLYPGRATPVLVLPKAAVKITARDGAGRLIGSYTR